LEFEQLGQVSHFFEILALDNYRFNSDVNESKNILEAARTEIDELVQNTDIPTGIAVEVVHEEDETREFTFLILAAFCDHLHDPGVCFRITYSPRSY